MGAILYWGDFEVGAILINVGAILTRAILQWGDLTCIHILYINNGGPSW